MRVPAPARLTKKEQDALVVQFQGLPVHILHKFCKAFPHWQKHWDDLIQEGNYGLCIAAEKYDPTVGASFKTYSYYWVGHYIRRAAKRMFKGGYEVALDSEGNLRYEGDENRANQDYTVSVHFEDGDQHLRAEYRDVARKVAKKLEQMRKDHGHRNVEILYRRLIADNRTGEHDAIHSYRVIGRDLGLTQERVRQINNQLRAEFDEWSKVLRDEENS